MRSALRLESRYESSRIVQVHSIERNARQVAGFIGSPKMNFIDVKVDRVGAASALVSSADTGPIAVPVQGSVAVGETLKLGIRPHHLTLAAEAPIAGTVRLIERLGHETIAIVALPSGIEIVAALPGDVALQIGQRVALDPMPAELHLFNAADLAA